MSADKDVLIQKIKCVVVGNGAVGKTSMVIKFSSYGKDNPVNGSMFLPTVCDIYQRTLMLKGRGEPLVLQICDTAGQEDYDRLRPLAYPNTDIFLICFQLCDRWSFECVSSMWIPELNHHCPNVPFFLIGCKDDLQDPYYDSVILVDGYLRQCQMINIIPNGIIKIMKEYAHNKADKPKDLISDKEARELCEKIGAVKYFSCSAAKDLKEGNIEEIFHEAAKYCIKPRKAPSTFCCNVL